MQLSAVIGYIIFINNISTYVHTYTQTYVHTRRRTHVHACMQDTLLQPEPITGSTRMKGGTTTKILLEVIFSLAHLLLGNHKITPTITTYGCYICMHIILLFVAITGT